MSFPVQEKVSVVTVYDRLTSTAMPKKMRWKNNEYFFTKLGYHHTVRFGRALMHIFHVTDGTTDFRLRFDTETLHWILEDMYSPDNSS